MRAMTTRISTLVAVLHHDCHVVDSIGIVHAILLLPFHYHLVHFHGDHDVRDISSDPTAYRTDDTEVSTPPP